MATGCWAILMYAPEKDVYHYIGWLSDEIGSKRFIKENKYKLEYQKYRYVFLEGYANPFEYLGSVEDLIGAGEREKKPVSPETIRDFINLSILEYLDHNVTSYTCGICGIQTIIINQVKIDTGNRFYELALCDKCELALFNKNWLYLLDPEESNEQ